MMLTTILFATLYDCLTTLIIRWQASV